MSFNLKIKRADKSRSSFDLSFPHLQSSEFFQNNVIFSKYCVPSDKWDISPALESRCAALVNPSFIDTKYHVRCFYVPHNIVWQRFDDWVNGNPTYLHGSLVHNGVPYITDRALTQIFMQPSFATEYEQFDASDWSDMINHFDCGHKWDFVVFSDSYYRTYKFTNKGRYIFKLLRSLGYKFVFTNSNDESTNYNGLALLSYMRIALDYMVPSVHVLASALNRYLSAIYESTEADNMMNYNSSLFIAALDDLYKCYYPSSYLTSMWQSPVQPLINNGSDIGSGTTNAERVASYNGTFSELTQPYDVNSYGDNGVLADSANPDGSFRMPSNTAASPWLQRNVQRIVDWLTRSRFVGSQQVLNILSRFGVKPDAPNLLQSRFIGAFTQDLNVADVTSTSFTEAANPDDNVNVGEYAGKMYSNASNQRNFHVEPDDYGCIICTSVITPSDVYYYQGVERELLKTKPIQFFQPEFDAVGCEVVSSRELMSGFYLPGTENLVGDFGVGFIPRYSSYKIPFANVSGDFAVPTLNEGYASFHHFRSMWKYGRFKDSDGVIHLNNVVPNTGEKDDINGVSFNDGLSSASAQTNLLITAFDRNQYNRIFNVTSDSIDHIYTMYYFKCQVSRPMRSIADSLLTEDGTNENKIDVSKPVIENN